MGCELTLWASSAIGSPNISRKSRRSTWPTAAAPANYPSSPLFRRPTWTRLRPPLGRVGHCHSRCHSHCHSHCRFGDISMCRRSGWNTRLWLAHKHTFARAQSGSVDWEYFQPITSMCISPRSSNQEIVPDDSVSRSGWPLPQPHHVQEDVEVKGGVAQVEVAAVRVAQWLEQYEREPFVERFHASKS